MYLLVSKAFELLDIELSAAGLPTESEIWAGHGCFALLPKGTDQRHIGARSFTISIAVLVLLFDPTRHTKNTVFSLVPATHACASPAKFGCLGKGRHCCNIFACRYAIPQAGADRT